MFFFLFYLISSVLRNFSQTDRTHTVYRLLVGVYNRDRQLNERTGFFYILFNVFKVTRIRSSDERAFARERMKMQTANKMLGAAIFVTLACAYQYTHGLTTTRHGSNL